MRNNSVYFLFLVFAFIACERYADMKDTDDVKGSSYIMGRLFLRDGVTQQVSGKPLGNKTIKLSYVDNPDTLNFLFTATTTEDGYFQFKNLRADKVYRLYYEETMNGVVYTAYDTLTPPRDTLALFAGVANDKQNGIHLVITDEQGGRLRNAEVCVYTSEALASPGNCEFSNYKLTTDTLGRAFKFNLPPQTYYLSVSFPAGNQKLSAQKMLTVGSRIVYDTLVARGVQENGFQYTVLDSTGTRVPGAQLCFFTSSFLYARDTCEGSNFQVVSDPDGYAVKNKVTPGTYYVYAHLDLDNLVLIGHDTISLAEGVVRDTIRLRRKL